jgi:hypothetical protein
MKTKSKSLSRKAIQAWPLVPAAALGALPANAEPPVAKASSPQVDKSKLPKFVDPSVLRVADIQVTPVLPKVGETVSVKVWLVNDSARALSQVPYAISGSARKSGTLKSFGAHSKQIVTATFTAQGASYSLRAVVDPANANKEPKAQFRNNDVKLEGVVLPSTPPGWGNHVSVAASRVPAMIDEYKAHTSVQGNMTGAALTITGLKVGNANPAALRKLLTDRGVPADLAQAIGETFVRAFKDWAGNYRGAVPLAYPAFAAWPGPTSAPTPNVPFPLGVGGGVQSAKALAPATIENVLRGQLSTGRKAAEGADATIRALSGAMSAQLVAWTQLQMVTKAMGQGQVPSFAPPYVPVGPVVMGTVLAAETHLVP